MGQLELVMRQSKALFCTFEEEDSAIFQCLTISFSPLKINKSKTHLELVEKSLKTLKNPTSSSPKPTNPFAPPSVTNRSRQVALTSVCISANIYQASLSTWQSKSFLHFPYNPEAANNSHSLEHEVVAHQASPSSSDCDILIAEQVLKSLSLISQTFHQFKFESEDGR
jgi:hypothetical protein